MTAFTDYSTFWGCAIPLFLVAVIVLLTDKTRRHAWRIRREAPFKQRSVK